MIPSQLIFSQPIVSTSIRFVIMLVYVSFSIIVISELMTVSARIIIIVRLVFIIAVCIIIILFEIQAKVICQLIVLVRIFYGFFVLFIFRVIFAFLSFRFIVTCAFHSFISTFILVYFTFTLFGFRAFYAFILIFCSSQFILVFIF